MFHQVVTTIFVFLPVFVSCKKVANAPRLQNPWSLIFHPEGFEDLRLGKPVTAHPSHPIRKTMDGDMTGWVYTYQYNGTACETDKAAYEYGMVTNQCFTSLSANTTDSPTVMVTCFGDYAYSILYNSTDCNPDTSINIELKQLNTCIPTNSSDVDGGHELYGLNVQQAFCVSESNIPVSGGEWVLASQYAEEDCADMYYFNAKRNDVCYQYEYYALRYSFPNATYYVPDFDVPNFNAPDEYSMNCSNPDATILSFEMHLVCGTDSVLQADDDFSYSNNVREESIIYSLYSSAGNITDAPTSRPTANPTAHPTAHPIVHPTAHPTAFPTVEVTTYPTTVPTIKATDDPTAVPTATPTTVVTGVPTVVSTNTPQTSSPTIAPTAPAVAYLIFTSNISLSGVSSANLDESSQRAIVNTTAISMNIPYGEVSFVSAYFVSVATFVSAHTRGGKIHTAASSSIVAVTKVNAPLSNTAQSTALYTQLTSTLNSAVSSNQFSTTLQSVSKATGATQTMNANATDVSSSAATVSNVDTTSSSSSNNNDLSEGAIAGIVIGGVAFLTLVIVGAYFYSQQQKSSTNTTAAEAPTVNIMMHSNPMSKNPASTLPAVATAIEEGNPENQTAKQLK